MVNAEISLDRLKQFGPKAYIYLDRLYHNEMNSVTKVNSPDVIKIMEYFTD